MKGLKIVLALIVISAATAGGVYLYVDHSQGMNALGRAKLELKTLGDHIQRSDPKSAHDLRKDADEAAFQIKQAKAYTLWVDQATRDELDAELDNDKAKIDVLDQLAGGKPNN